MSIDDDRSEIRSPGAQIRVLYGHAHMAHRTHPAMVAAIVTEFLSS